MNQPYISAKHTSTLTDHDTPTVTDLGAAPISILRPLFLHLQNPDVLARIHTRLLALLQRQTHPDDSALVLLPTWSSELTPALRAQFRESLRTHLFGWDSFLAQRLQVSLASFCQVSAPSVRFPTSRPPTFDPPLFAHPTFSAGMPA